MIIKNFKQKIVSTAYFAANCEKKYAFICWAQILPYFIEYVHSLDVFSFVITFDVDEVKQLVPFTRFYKDCIFVYPTNVHMPQMIEFALESNCLLFNCEQMSIPERAELIFRFVDRGGKVFDYNSRNRDLIIEHWSSAKVITLPYRCTDSEHNQLAKLLTKEDEKEYDVAIVASMTRRREKIVQDLERASIKVLVIRNKFGAERDELIAKCTYLLNIHANDNYNVFETLRCFRWLDAGMVVISEPCIGTSINQRFEECHPNLKIVETDDLTKYILEHRKESIVKPVDKRIYFDKSPLALLNEWLNVDFVFQENDSIEYCYGAKDKYFRVTNHYHPGDYVSIRLTDNFNYQFGDPAPNDPKNLVIISGESQVSLPEQREFHYRITFLKRAFTIYASEKI